MSWFLQASVSLLEFRASVCEQVYAQALEEDAWISTSLLSHLDGVPADFHSQVLWGLLFMALIHWAEWNWDPLLLMGHLHS